MAAGAADLHLRVDNRCHFMQHRMIFRREDAHPRMIGGPDVFFQHLFTVHTGQYHCDFLLIPQPQKAPLRRAVTRTVIAEDLNRILRKLVDQLAAAQILVTSVVGGAHNN